MENKDIALTVGLFLLLIVVFGCCSPSGRMIWNRWFYQVQKTDDATNYSTLKNIEDSCRAMMASYNSDEMVYRQYKDSENEEKQTWAEQAKMRANRLQTKPSSNEAEYALDKRDYRLSWRGGGRRENIKFFLFSKRQHRGVPPPSGGKRTSPAVLCKKTHAKFTIFA